MGTGVDSPTGGVAPVRCSEEPVSLTLELSCIMIGEATPAPHREGAGPKGAVVGGTVCPPGVM
jgi:hypothetical protein